MTCPPPGCGFRNVTPWFSSKEWVTDGRRINDTRLMSFACGVPMAKVWL